MAEKDSIGERGRALEEEYFRKRDRELIDKMRRAAEAEQARADLGARTGITDPDALRQLQELGFTPDTVVLLPLMPVLQVAWAEGGVTPEERALILKLARTRGIEEGSAADRQLAAWLERRPADQVFADANRLIRAMLDAPSNAISADEVVKQCEAIAAASGGFLGINRVSAEERQLLAAIAEQIKKH